MVRERPARTRTRKLRSTHVSAARLRAMIEEATVDCYDETEQVTGLFTMLDEHLAVPFETSMLGAVVRVERVELTRGGTIVAVCSRGAVRQRIPILELPLPSPPPAGAGWIAAYRRWTGERSAR